MQATLSNAGSGCGTGAGGFQPGNTCARGRITNKVFIHETDAPNFSKFDISKIGSGQGESWLGRGIYLQEKGSFKIENYGANKVEVKLTPDANIFEIENTPNGKYRDSFVEFAIQNNIGAARGIAEERIKDGLSLKNLLARDILRNNPEATLQLQKAGFDGLLLDGELVVYNDKVLRITSADTAHIANAVSISAPLPFKEAVKYVSDKHLLPTTLSSEQLMELDPAVRERAMFSARTANAWYLQKIKDTVDRIVGPEEAGGKPWTGVNAGSGRAQLKDALKSIGYAPEPGKAGGIQDLSSDARLNLILSTQVDMAHGYGQRLQALTPIAQMMFPAYELVRQETRKEPRDWPQRWEDAGGEFYPGVETDYPQGRMIALKTDPIWSEISAFSLPYPPFDFNSGMGLREISAEECENLGIEVPEPDEDEAEVDADDFMPSAASAEQFDPEVLESLVESLGTGYQVIKGVLQMINEAVDQPRDERGRFAATWTPAHPQADPPGEPSGKIRHAVLVIAGKRYRGPSHFQAIMAASLAGDEPKLDAIEHEGFETESGHFLNREQAASYAGRGGWVSSEDLKFTAHEGRLYTQDALQALAPVSPSFTRPSIQNAPQGSHGAASGLLAANAEAALDIFSSIENHIALCAKS